MHGFIDQFIDKKKFQVILLGWILPPDPDCYAIWHSDSVKAGLNSVSYRNKEVDDLIEKGRSEFNQTKRENIYRKIHNIIANEAPYTFLFFRYSMPATNKRFKNIKPEKSGIMYNFIDWHVPDSEVKYDF